MTTIHQDIYNERQEVNHQGKADDHRHRHHRVAIKQEKKKEKKKTPNFDENRSEPTCTSAGHGQLGPRPGT